MANTGYKHWRTLEEYDLDTGLPTGRTKPNVENDSNYVPPTYDTSTCPLPPPNLGWRSINPYCVKESGENNGYVAYASLEQYNLDTGESTGVYKANEPSDPDYMAPVYDPNLCEVTLDNESPVFIQQPRALVTPTSISINWESTDNVEVTSQDILYRKTTDSTYLIVPIGADDTGFILRNLSEGATYTFYIMACDGAGNCTASNTVTATTATLLRTVRLSRSFKSFDPCSGPTSTYYIDGFSIGAATKLYTNTSGTNLAPPAYYSDGGYSRYWNGSSWPYREEPCGGPAGPTLNF